MREEIIKLFENLTEPKRATVKLMLNSLYGKFVDKKSTVKLMLNSLYGKKE